MSKKIPLGLSIVLIVFAVLITFQITYLSIAGKYSQKLNEVMVNQNLYNKLAEIDSIYKNLFIGELDEQQVNDSIINGYVRGTSDKFGSYLTAEQYKEYKSQYEGESVGIGVMVVYNDTIGALEITTVMENSPAKEAGLLPGDLIVAADGENIADIGYYAIINSIKGDEGSTLDLTYYRLEGGEYAEYNITLERRTVSYLSVLSTMYSDGITAVIVILSFDLNTPEQFIDAVNNATEQGAKRFVFDVRDNSGGELNSIHKILDFLLPEGPVIRTVDKNGGEESMTSDAEQLDVPMVVLINSRTASAAELFASALRDYDKAKLIGTNSFGKGTMQSVIELSDNSALIISVKKYSPPFSDNYDGIGLKPDVELEYNGENGSDNQLLAAIDLLNQ
jgi:carboxyl-terminal processing protease